MQECFNLFFSSNSRSKKSDEAVEIVTPSKRFLEILENLKQQKPHASDKSLNESAHAAYLEEFARENGFVIKKF